MSFQDMKARFLVLFEDKLREKIEEASMNGEKSLVLDFFDDLDKYDSELGDALLENPREAFIAGSEALQEIDVAFENKLKYLRIKSLPDAYKKRLNKIKPAEVVGKLIEFEGIVKRITEVHSRIKNATFVCSRCGAEKTIDMFSVYELPKDGIDPPIFCDSCGRKSLFSLVESKSERIDYQKLEVQEFFEEMDLSGAKHKMIVYAFDDLVNVASAGDRVKVIGILYDKPAWRRGKVMSSTRVIECVALWIEPLEKSFEEIEITQEDVEKIKKVSKDPDIYEKFVDCIAPSIYGLRAIKKGILLQLFGGIPKVVSDKTRRRGDIHILLIGDPATAKSQLTFYATKLSPKGIFVGSKTATATGLIASVVKDSEFGEGRWILDAGAMALADMGMVGLDELDKMRHEDRDALHTAMEQQEVTVAKAGITATLKTRCSVIANANPKLGRFDDIDREADQINLPHSLLSRFDLIFVLKDKPDEKRDEKLAEHVLNVHAQKEITIPFDIDFIRKYIAYAKKYIFPKLTDEASKKIKEYYVNTRKRSGETFPLTPRYLETLIRLSEASARVRLSEVVEEIDVRNAIEVLEFSLWTSALDEETQKFDTDKIDIGIPYAKRNKIYLIMKMIEEYYMENKEGIRIEDLIERCVEHGMDRYEVKNLIEKLKMENKIIEPKDGIILPLLY